MTCLLMLVVLIVAAVLVFGAAFVHPVLGLIAGIALVMWAMTAATVEAE